MNTLRKMKNLTLYSLLTPLMIIAGAGVNSPTQAACFGYPVSTDGCRVYTPSTGRYVSGPCQGTATANIIVAMGIGALGCTNSTAISAGLEPLPYGACVIQGAGGNDIIIPSGTGFSSSYMMLVCGSTGNDLILGGDNNDALLGEAGNDIMIGMGGTNYLFGGSDDDILLTGGITSRPSHNFNDGGLNTPTGKDVCQKGLLGVDLAGCEIHLP